MPIELEYSDMNSVPEQFRELYEEKDGKAVLVGVTGMKTQADVDQVRTALGKERDAHKVTRDKLRAWGDSDPTEIMGKLDLLKGIEDKIGGDLTKLDESDLVKGKIAQATGPLTRQIETLNGQIAEKDQKLGEYAGKERARQISDIVKDAATKSGVHATAIGDIELVAGSMMEFDDAGKLVVRDGVNGATPGLDAAGWLAEMQKTRPHWWPNSSGSGANGKGQFGGFTGNNPWSGEHWNMTEQGKILSADRSKAEQLAKAAGTTIGGPKPQPKK